MKQLLETKRGLCFDEPICEVEVETDGDLTFENKNRYFRFDLGTTDQVKLEEVIDIIRGLWREPEKCLEKIEELCPRAGFSEKERERIIYLFKCLAEHVDHKRRDGNRL